MWERDKEKERERERERRYISIHSSLYQYIDTSIHPSIHLQINLFIHKTIHLSVHPYVHTSMHLYIHVHPTGHTSSSQSGITNSTSNGADILYSTRIWFSCLQYRVSFNIIYIASINQCVHVPVHIIRQIKLTGLQSRFHIDVSNAGCLRVRPHSQGYHVRIPPEPNIFVHCFPCLQYGWI